MSEINKRKLKVKYNILLVPESDEDGANKISVNGKTAFRVCAAVLLLLIVLLIYSFYLANSLVSANTSISEFRQQVETLSEENKTLTAQNGELQSKVSILSDTVNDKVQQEEEREAEIAKSYVPTGFPLKGTASYNEENTVIDGEPAALFQAGIGTSVIATANGKVSSIAGDVNVGYIIMIDHGNGYYSVYRNGSKPLVSEGDEVTVSTELYNIEAGHEQLGYQIIENDSYIDPMSIIEIYG